MKVVVAVITEAKHRVLITRRPFHASHGGMWEFPGGKLEHNESPSSALIREIKEEVGLDVVGYQFLGEISHTYNHQLLTLLVFHVNRYEGIAVCCEDQLDLRWVQLSELGNFSFPAANLEIISLYEQYESVRQM